MNYLDSIVLFVSRPRGTIVRWLCLVSIFYRLDWFHPMNPKVIVEALEKLFG